MSYKYRQLTTNDLIDFRNLLQLFGEVFEDETRYKSQEVQSDYLLSFLKNSQHIVLIAEDRNHSIVGGLVAYELTKFEQERKEFFVYDLAVSVAHHRQGIASSLFDTLKEIARQRGAYVVFVQADKADDGAVAFYKSLKPSEVIEAYNFDLNV